MMRVVLAFVLTLAVVVSVPEHVAAQASVPTIEQLRSLFYKASESSDDADKLSDMVEVFTEQQPLQYGYRAMADFLQAKHSYNPISKMRAFNRGRDRLERAIVLLPGSVELRFLRFAVQAKAPSVLGYKDHLEEDKPILLGFLRAQQKHQSDHDLVHRIARFLKNCDVCSDAERSFAASME